MPFIVTPDSWTSKHHRHGIFRVMRGNQILADHITDNDPDQAAKNAALMAAAPLLLTMLQRLYDEVRMNPEPWIVASPCTLEHVAMALDQARGIER